MNIVVSKNGAKCLVFKISNVQIIIYDSFLSEYVELQLESNTNYLMFNSRELFIKLISNSDVL